MRSLHHAPTRRATTIDNRPRSAESGDRAQALPAVCWFLTAGVTRWRSLATRLQVDARLLLVLLGATVAGAIAAGLVSGEVFTVLAGLEPFRRVAPAQARPRFVRRRSYRA